MSFDKKFIFVPVFGLMIAGNDAFAANGRFTKDTSSKMLDRMSFRGSIYAGYNYGSVLNNPFSGGFSERTTKGQHSPIVGMNFDMLFKLNDRVSLLSGIDVAGMWPITKMDFRDSLRQEVNTVSIVKTNGGTISHEHLSGQNDIIINKPVIVDNSLANTKDFSAVSIVNAIKPNAKEEIIVGQTPEMKDITVNVQTGKKEVVVGQTPEMKDITVNIPVYEKRVVEQTPIMKDITVNVPTGKKEVVVGQTPVMRNITNVPTGKKVVAQVPITMVDNITVNVQTGKKEVVVGQTPEMKDITVNIPVYEKRVVGKTPVFNEAGEAEMKDITVNVPTGKEEIIVGQTPEMKDITVNIPVYEKRVVGKTPVFNEAGEAEMKDITVNVPTGKEEIIVGQTPEMKDITVNIPVYEKRVVGKTPVFNEAGEAEMKDITVNVPTYEKSETEIIRKIPQSAKETTITIPKYEMIVENRGNTLSDNAFTVKTGVNTGERKEVVVGQIPEMKDITVNVPTGKEEIIVGQTPEMKDITVNIPVYEKRVVGKTPVFNEAGEAEMKDITVNIPVYEKKEHVIKAPNIVKVGARKIGVTTKQIPMFVNYEQDIATVPAYNNIEENIQISEQPKQQIISTNYNSDYSIREFGKLSANFGADIKITKYINLTVYGSAGINLARINYSESNIVSTFMNNELIGSKISSSSINKFNIGQTFSLGSRVLLYDKYEISASYRVSINSNSSIKSNVPLKNTVYTHNFMLTIGYRWF